MVSPAEYEQTQTTTTSRNQTTNYLNNPVSSEPGQVRGHRRDVARRAAQAGEPSAPVPDRSQQDHVVVLEVLSRATFDGATAVPLPHEDLDVLGDGLSFRLASSWVRIAISARAF
jgi:hypothetical protein